MTETPTTDIPARRAGRPANARVQRQPVREDLVRAQARDKEDTNRLRRTHRRTVDGLSIDPKVIPDGFSYEWKRETCFNEPDLDHMTNLQENHWRPVPASRHPHLMPEGKRDGAIRRKGLLLMERPSYLTKEARQEDYELAREQVHIKEDQLGRTPAGTNTRNRITHGIDAQIIVAKE